MDAESRELYRAVGRRLAALRKDRGLRQDDIGDEISLSRAAVANMEAGTQSITSDTLLRLSLSLDASPIEIAPELDRSSAKSAGPDNRHSVAHLASDLDQHEIKWVEDIINSASKAPNE